ncbi:hypothetical protein HDV06_003639 [Boothiomyces sp. JEL0866]|nr:hypothetical protein HDV06_003639 [Boothiomyces sp. JEL0866]
MTFFKEHRAKNLNLVDPREKRIELDINVSPRKGIWRKEGQWYCNKRNQFQLAVNINASSSPIFQKNNPILLYKVEVSCTDINGINKIEVLQKTSSGLKRVRPFYVTAEQKTTLIAGKLQFSRSTVSKNRNLPVQDFNVFVSVSLVGMSEDEHHIATLTSEDLSVLPYGEPKPRTFVKTTADTSLYTVQPSAITKLPEQSPIHSPPTSTSIIFNGYSILNNSSSQSFATLHQSLANGADNLLGNISPLSTNTDYSLPSPNSLSFGENSLMATETGYRTLRSNSFGHFGQMFPAAGYSPLGYYLHLAQQADPQNKNNSESLSEDISNLFSN